MINIFEIYGKNKIMVAITTFRFKIYFRYKTGKTKKTKNLSKSFFDPRIGLNRILTNGDIILKIMDFVLHRDFGKQSIIEEKILIDFRKNRY